MVRSSYGDTLFYADKANLSRDQLNAAFDRIHRREMAELFRLAQLGLLYERSTP